MGAVIQAVWIGKMCSFTAKLRRPLVHPICKGCHAAGNMLRQTVGHLIGRFQKKGIQGLLHRKLIPCRKLDGNGTRLQICGSGLREGHYLIHTAVFHRQ